MPDPICSKQRTIVLTPTSMINADVDVWVNGKKQLKIDLKDPKTELFNFKCDSKFNSAIHIKIVVNKGRVVLDQNNAAGVYCAAYDNTVYGDCISGKVSFPQENFVFWMISPSKQPSGSSIHIEEGETFEYMHLVPNGPNWIEIYFSNEKDRLNFQETSFVNKSMAERSMFKPYYDYPVVDEYCNKQERTENLIKLLDGNLLK
jgi:hypothetical protein